MEGEGPASKKPRTTNVVVEQAGQSDKLLIDQIADLDSVFEEVYTYICIAHDSSADGVLIAGVVYSIILTCCGCVMLSCHYYLTR